MGFLRQVLQLPPLAPLTSSFSIRLRSLVLLAAAWACLPAAHAALQFDVFLGYGGQPTGADGIVRETGWFSVGCEVHNDGPTFNAVFEVSNARGGGQARRLALELPTNTRKRFVIPVFSGAGQYATWEARLLDDRGRVRAEYLNLRPRTAAWETLLVGAVPRSFAGLPSLPNLRGDNARSTLQPLVARIPVEQLPVDPIAYEGLDALYLNSEKALELKEPQAEALLSWIRGGGHLILAIEQPSDVNSLDWLRPLLPGTVNNMVNVRASGELHAWLRQANARYAEDLDAPRAVGVRRQNLPGMIAQYPPVRYRFPRLFTEEIPDSENPYLSLAPDPAIEQVEFPVSVGTIRRGQVQLSVGGLPLAVTAPDERGHVTVLLFSPERQPFLSWKHRPWFWARLLQVPPAWFRASPAFNTWGGNSADAVAGSMIDSRQIRKLPVPWLLLLLAVYLAVIGPFDRYLLRRLNRQMLTWVTFPGYVVLFSLLIYYIGYRLRAGETECNQLHIVDVIPRELDTVDLRGRTYTSIYSPVNARYRMTTDLPYATLRGESLGPQATGQEGSRADVQQLAQGFDAQVFVPVWTSQLFVSDWLNPAGNPPLKASLVPQGPNLRLRIENHMPVAIPDLRLVLQGQLYELGALQAGESREISLDLQQGKGLLEFTQQHGNMFLHAAQQRNRALGSSQAYTVDPNATTAITFSFLSQLSLTGGNERQFLYPAGLDLGALVERGDAILLAWIPKHAPVPSFRRFNAVRSAEYTLLRLAIPTAQLSQ